MSDCAVVPAPGIAGLSPENAAALQALGMAAAAQRLGLDSSVASHFAGGLLRRSPQCLQMARSPQLHDAAQQLPLHRAAGPQPIPADADSASPISRKAVQLMVGVLHLAHK